ncbi:hypothetical protein [Intrasporangium calvum]|uniref:Lipoprotein n=1 Tax=Intrasporangium calvum (strain ATCC 23552 / DSM 43043 / JCM 3097 / NBRC 12989 / NCIMB 10167 / NRRL B-3866 / 7 KIP) TaxID=710696 RepID=E6S880_INTC7|nr:hypothetical protein [Intrasporangium calvum]ADU46984.1 hypothetical protein Intca_0436 [Intrasporangium calvum DSM 43043]AXG12254.1 hypothetical protein DN585_01315 [Intrasporangium calvum]
MPLSRVAGLVVLAPLVLGTAGCGSPEAATATSAASRFVRLASDDVAAACDLLAPATRSKVTEDGGGDCAAGLRSADLPAGSATGPDVDPEIAGHTAMVTTGGQTLFLALFDDGWKVIAAGCTRTSADLATPYDCAVRGE